MPPYGYTLSKSEIDALIAYIRLISDPPYRASEWCTRNLSYKARKITNAFGLGFVD